MGVIPIPVIIMLFIFFLGWVFLNRTKIGRYIYGLGGNREAVRLSGVYTARIEVLVFMISAFLTGIAKVDQKLIILLDLEKVLSPEEKAALQTVPALAGAAEKSA